MNNRNEPLWDLPTRASHWLIVLAMPLAWWSAETQRYELHQWVGYSVLVLVIARLIWGFIGSHYSRFTAFLAGPAKVLRYITAGEWRGIGHNPLGAWSAMLLWALLVLQAVSGMFNSDDILFTGPFYYAADTALRDSMGAIHDWAFNVLLALIAVHVLAVLHHQRRGDRLLQAMFHGYSKNGDSGFAPTPARRWLAVLAALGGLLWWAVSNAPQPSPSWF